MEDIYIELLRSISPIAYKRLMYGEWVTPTKQEQLLEDATKEYHDRCDAYDKRVCTAISPRTGEPIPENADQQRAINAHARDVKKDILARYGITEKELHDAIVAYRR